MSGNEIASSHAASNRLKDCENSKCDKGLGVSGCLARFYLGFCIWPIEAKAFRYDCRLNGRRKTLAIGWYNPALKLSREPNALEYGMGLSLREARTLLDRASVPTHSTYPQAECPAPVQMPAGHKVTMETVGFGQITYEYRAKKDTTTEHEWVFGGPNA